MGIVREYVQEVKPFRDEFSSRQYWERSALNYVRLGNNVTVNLPTGTVQFRRRFSEYPHVSLELHPNEDEMNRFFRTPDPVLFGIDNNAKRKLQRTFTPKNGNPITYAIRFDGYSFPLDAKVELPGVKKTRYQTQADGYLFEKSSWRLSKAAIQKRYEQSSRVLEDAVSNFGFDDVSQIDAESGRVSHVCIVPMSVEREWLAEMLQKALESCENKFEVDFSEKCGTDEIIYRFDLRRNADGLYAEAEARASQFLKNRQIEAIQHTLSAFGSEPYDDAEVVIGRYRTRISWESMPKPIRQTLEYAGKPISFVLKQLKEWDSELDYKDGREKSIRENITTGKLKDLEIRENVENPESCFIVLTPKMQREIDAEVEQKLSQEFSKD